MSSKDIMRKARADEASKNSSTLVRSHTRNKVLAKEENSDITKKILEKNIAVEKQSKVAIKTSSTTSTKKKPGGGLERQSASSLTVGSKAPKTSRSGTGKSMQESSRTLDRNARTKPTGERKLDGISTIYMPKTTQSTKSLGESNKVSAVSSMKSKSSLGKAASSRSKDASIKVMSSRSKDNLVKATSLRSKDAPVKVSATRSVDASSKTPAYMEIKDSTVESSKKHSTSRRLPSRERRRSRTLSPSEVKVLHPQYAANSGVAEVKAGLEGSVPSKLNRAEKSDSDDNDYEYEDDFESYESDFEECTDSAASEVSEVSNESDDEPNPVPVEMQTEKQRTTITSVDSRKSDEERMLDSGHYDLSEARRRAARVDSVAVPQEAKKLNNCDIILQPSISPYREERSSDNKSLPSSTDEGFEDARSGDFAKSPPMSQMTLIDFRKIAENKPAKISAPKQVTRGEKLLEMIRLDTVGWSILESKPVAYEEFIRTHGKMNSRQIFVQTNEDNLNVETQTEVIECSSKWTQFPTRCRAVLKNDDDIKRFNMERLGVGGENDAETVNTISRPVYDVLRLNDFLGQAGKVVLSLLEERISGNSADNEHVHELPFSESIVKLSIDSVTFLAGRPVTIIHYSELSNKILLTIHSPVDEDIQTPRDEDFVTDCSIGCVWNILHPSRPTKIFYSSSAITACCFHSASYNVVLAGLADGSISLWDLAEDETWHRKIVDDANEIEWVVRSPTYSSIASFDEAGHNSEIVALRVLSKFDNEPAAAARSKFMPIQICSLDDNGRLIIWSVLRNLSRAGIDDLGLSWWGELRLVKSQEISFFSKKTSERNNHLKGFSDMHVDRLDKNALYIATNTPNILHATRLGKHANPPAYKSSGMDWCGETRCIESCPFDQPYFMVGCADGTVRLHSTTTEKPLVQLKHEECTAAVKIVQWSRSKPLTLYVLDVDSKIHIWDLGSSDMFPVHTISTDDWAHIECIQLSPCRTTHEMTNQYMALASDIGCVEVHRLKEGFYYAHKAAVKQEMNTFLRYVTIL